MPSWESIDGAVVACIFTACRQRAMPRLTATVQQLAARPQTPDMNNLRLEPCKPTTVHHSILVVWLCFALLVGAMHRAFYVLSCTFSSWAVVCVSCASICRYQQENRACDCTHTCLLLASSIVMHVCFVLHVCVVGACVCGLCAWIL